MTKNIPAKKDPFTRWILFGIPILFIVATPLHFLFEWTGESPVAAPFVPVNESVWEHLKLTFWPVLIWWIIGYFLYLKKKNGGFSRAAVTCAVAELFSAVFIIVFFYGFEGGLNMESLALDIIILFLGLLFGILLARHIDIHTRPGGFAAFVSVVLVLVMAAAFIYFTFAPPHLPLFMDPPTGTYGI